MKKTMLAISGLSILMGCAQPNTTVLPAYKLADGRVYQDVVSVGADGDGAAPTVTMVNTYALSVRAVKGTKSGTPTELRRVKCNKGVYCVRPVASAAASQSGVWNIAVAGASAGLAGAALTNALQHSPSGTGTTIYNTNSQTQGQNQSQNQNQSMP